MDHHIPLLEWAKGTTLEHAKESSSKPIKEVIVEMFAALLWLEIGSFDTLDVNGDGFITRNEVRPRAVEIFGEDVADLVVENFFSVAGMYCTVIQNDDIRKSIINNAFSRLLSLFPAWLNSCSSSTTHTLTQTVTVMVVSLQLI
ncbi:MAG: hypothetical protein ACI8RD_011850 [Bacillariaceae sp.]|jgi:hypothetical protein